MCPNKQRSLEPFMCWDLCGSVDLYAAIAQRVQRIRNEDGEKNATFSWILLLPLSSRHSLKVTMNIRHGKRRGEKKEEKKVGVGGEENSEVTMTGNMKYVFKMALERKDGATLIFPHIHFFFSFSFLKFSVHKITKIFFKKHLPTQKQDKT